MAAFLYVPNHDVKRILTPARANDIAEETLLDHFNGLVSWPDTRLMSLAAPSVETRYLMKACLLTRQGIAGFRVSGVNRSSEGQAIATYRPTKNILLSDIATGEFFAVVDERWAYAIRTGACSAVAVKYLMADDADECAILGSGHMAYGSLLAINEVMPLARVRVWSPNREHREEFSARMKAELNTEVSAMDTVEDCVRGVKVVVTATSASRPFLKHAWLSSGVVVYTIGGHQEIEASAYRKMTLVVDDRAQVNLLPHIRKMSETGHYADEVVSADLGQVVGSKEHGRKSVDEQILVESQGLVSQDVAQAYWIYQEAERQQLGISLERGLVEEEGEPRF